MMRVILKFVVWFTMMSIVGSAVWYFGIASPLEQQQFMQNLPPAVRDALG